MWLPKIHVLNPNKRTGAFEPRVSWQIEPANDGRHTNAWTPAPSSMSMHPFEDKVVSPVSVVDGDRDSSWRDGECMDPNRALAWSDAKWCPRPCQRQRGHDASRHDRTGPPNVH